MSVLTVGETMALLDPVEDGPLDAGRRLTLRIAGAESNVAVALARLGVEATWVSALGADAYGDLVERTLVAEGVRVVARRDPERPTGLFTKWRDGGRSHVLYHRHGSAASALRPDDVPDELLDGVRLVHLTGITTALGDGPRALVHDVARRAAADGATVLFDPNWRPALWASPAAAAAAHVDLLPHVDWYLCGLEEGRLLWGGETARGRDRRGSLRRRLERRRARRRAGAVCDGESCRPRGSPRCATRSAPATGSRPASRGRCCAAWRHVTAPAPRTPSPRLRSPARATGRRIPTLSEIEHELTGGAA